MNESLIGVDAIMKEIHRIAWRASGPSYRNWLIATGRYIKTSKRKK